MALVDTEFPGACRVWLCPFFGLVGLFRHVPRIFVGASFLLQGFFLRSVLKFRSIGATLMRIRTLNLQFGMDSFPNFHVACCTFSEFHVALRILCPCGRSTWISADPCPGIRNLFALISSVRQQSLHHHFSSASCWADCQPLCAWTCTFQQICIPNLFCNFDKREDAKNHMTGSYGFHSGNFCTVSGSFSRRSTASGTLLLRRIFPSFGVCGCWCRRGRSCYFSTLTVIVAEAASISLRTLWRKVPFKQ